MLKPFRQGDVLLIPTRDEAWAEDVRQPHLVLAEGEATGHRHQITVGQAELFDRHGTLYLRVISETARLTHEEHGPIELPQGFWRVQIQREFHPNNNYPIRYVRD
jgi:hypothetical protein